MQLRDTFHQPTRPHPQAALRHAVENLEESCKTMEEKVQRLAGNSRRHLEALREELDENFTKAQLETRLDRFWEEVQCQVRTVEDDLSTDIRKCADDLALVADGGVISSELSTAHRRSTEEVHTKKSEFNALVLNEFVNFSNTYQLRGNVWDVTLLLGADIPMGRAGTPRDSTRPV